MRRALFHDSGVIDDGDDTLDIPGLSGLSAHLADTSDAHDASAISFSPTGSIGSTDVQAAIAEVAAEATGAVSSVFGRTGGVVAVTGDYYGAVAAALTGATQASRYAGATASGPPLSGTFVKGDWVVAQDGHIWICTTGGTPGSWADIGGGGSYTDEQAQDAIGGILTDTSTIDLTYNDGTPSITADVKVGSIGATELASTAVTPGSYGDATHAGQFTVDADGRITAAASVGITGAGTGITDPGGSDDDVLQRKSGGWTNRTIAQLKTDLALPTPGLVLICDSVLGSDQASFDTNTILGGNIPATYKHLMIKASLRSDVNTTSDASALVVNNDTTAGNYKTQRIEGSPGVSGTFFNGTLVGYVGSTTGATSPTASFSMNQIDLIDYLSANDKMFLSNAGGYQAAATTFFGQNLWTTWLSTAAITRLALKPVNGSNWKAGSRFTLYGLA